MTLVGHVPDETKPAVRIEGYGGWTAERFMTYFKAEKRPEGQLDWKAWNACGSPFLYADGQGRFKADFGQYCREFNAGQRARILSPSLSAATTHSPARMRISKRASTRCSSTTIG